MLALLLLLGTPAPVHAAASPPAPAGARAEAPASAIELSAEPMQPALHGFPVLVELEVENAGSEPADFPDLSTRPWEVRFRLERPGLRRSLSNTPPEREPEASWQLPPGGRRRVVLEIPGSAALAPGDYALRVEVEGLSWEGRLLVQRAAPATASVEDDAPGAAPSGWLTPWVQASAPHTLYLHRQSQPASRGYQLPLAELDRVREVRLSASAPEQAEHRDLYWREGNALWLLRLDGRAGHEPPRRVGLPYPGWEPLARGVTDASGAFRLAIWLPSPGGGGSLRLLAVEGTSSQLSRGIPLEERPLAASTADGAGRLRLAVLRGDGLELYTAEPGRDPSLPPQGVLLHLFEGDEPRPQGLLFAEHPRGLALLGWWRGEAVLEARWWSLEGEELGRSSLPLPPGELRQLLPWGDGLAALLEQSPGRGLLVTPGGRRDLRLGPLDALRLGPRGGLWLYRPENFRAERLESGAD